MSQYCARPTSPIINSIKTTEIPIHYLNFPVNETQASAIARDKPGRLHQKMMGYRKKNKLDIGTVTMEQVTAWISN